MDNFDYQKRPIKNKYFLISTFYIYILCIYSLIYRVSENDLETSTSNRYILFFILIVVFIGFLSRVLYLKSNVIDMLNIVTIVYLTSSLLIYTIFSNMILSDVLRELLYSIIPILFYFIAKTFSEKEIDLFFSIFFYSTFFVVALGILNLFGVPLPEALKKTLTKGELINFASNYGPIILGYISQLFFALFLFNKMNIGKLRYVFLCFFFVICILTLQRSSYIGVLCGTIIYMLYERKKYFLKFVMIIAVLVVLLYTVLTLNLTEVVGVDLSYYIQEEFAGLSFNNVIKDRENQALIFNESNVLNILFGEGYGKYSPNNTNTICQMPDASFYRIYNELGLVGGFIFFLPFIMILIKALSQRNGFKVYFIFFTLIAFYFNRVLWAVPLSYVIYTIVGINENPNYNRNNIQNSNGNRMVVFQ